MKKGFYIFLLLLVSEFNYAQEKSTSAEQPEVYTIVEEQAEFPGGVSAMMKYIQEKLVYPEIARKYCIGGKTFLKFIVNEDGNISDCSVILSSGATMLDEAAVEVITHMPVWKSAKMTGRPVKCYFNIPISFSLSSPYIVFNKENTNLNYLLAKEALLDNGDESKALTYLQKAVGDPDSWYVMGVIYYNQKDMSMSKQYFQNAKNSAPVGSKSRDLSESFLTKYF